jgi:hypothetical protein
MLVAGSYHDCRSLTLRKSAWRSHIGVMEVYIFKSKQGSGVTAYSLDRDGENLPASFGPWQQGGPTTLPVGEPPWDRIAQEIERDGQYVLTDGSGTMAPTLPGAAL